MLGSHSYLIRPSVLADVYQLAANLRHEDREELESMGMEPRKTVRFCFRSSILSRTVEVDRQIAAMWGFGGALLSNVGDAFLLTAPPIERIRFSFVREARHQVADMLEQRQVLSGYVAASYRGACRFLEVLGFTLGDPQPIGPRGALFREYRIER